VTLPERLLRLFLSEKWRIQTHARYPCENLVCRLGDICLRSRSCGLTTDGWKIRGGLMNSKIIYVALFALAPALAYGQSASVSERAKAEQTLRAARPGLNWRHELSIDVNCDKLGDKVFTAQDATRYYVAAVVTTKAGAPKISELQFQLSGSSQDSFCGSPEPLKPESLNYVPAEDLGYTPEGFRRSTRCKGLYLTAGECDSFHLYWNHVAGKLDWWRL
jgi:hypothetical protein